ncbi:MAG: hypothetical protein ABSH06_00285 [Thermodesulfobacteriota bacterium]
MESKYQRRIKLRIDDLIDELGRPLIYEEVKVEFKKRGFHRPFRRVVEDILQDRKEGTQRGGPGKMRDFKFMGKFEMGEKRNNNKGIWGYSFSLTIERE